MSSSVMITVIVASYSIYVTGTLHWISKPCFMGHIQLTISFCKFSLKQPHPLIYTLLMAETSAELNGDDRDCMTHKI